MKLEEENLCDYRCFYLVFCLGYIYIFCFYVRSIGWLIDRFATRALENEEEMKSGLCLTKMNRWEGKKKNDIPAVVNKFLA